MFALHRLNKYLAGLSSGRLLLWSYFIWYLVVVIRYFEARASLWLTAAGLSLIIGTALWINTVHSGSKRVKLERWPIARLFLFPFCVSSFSALVKGRGFILIFSPNPWEMLVGGGLCAALWLVVLGLKRSNHPAPLAPEPGGESEGIIPAFPGESPPRQISR